MTAVYPICVGEGIHIDVLEDFDFSNIDSSSLSYDKSYQEVELDFTSGEFGFNPSSFGGIYIGVNGF